MTGYGRTLSKVDCISGAAASNDHMLISRCYQHRAPLQNIASPSLADRNGAAGIQPLRKCTYEGGWHMLHNDDGWCSNRQLF